MSPFKMSDYHPTELCSCGCGLPAPMSTFNYRRRGRVYLKGQAKPFRRGHRARNPKHYKHVKSPR